GQTDPQVSFMARGGGMQLFLTPGAAVLSLARQADATATGSVPTRDVLSLQFVGANPAARVTGDQELTSRSNYFNGSGPGITNVANYAGVTYHGLYPGIDAHFFGNAANQLEYDFIVSPGADLSAVQMSIQGAQAEQLDAQQNLVIQTAGGQLVQ